MRWLIRHITRQEATSVEQQDTEYQGEYLTIGRATSQTIHISDRTVSLKHAEIKALDETSLQIKTKAISGVTINSQRKHVATVSVGDKISIGSSELEIIQPPQGYDFALTVKTVDKATQKAATIKNILTLEKTGLNKRRWAWSLFVGILALFLLLPLTGMLSEPVNKILQATPLPDDKVWNSGPLHSAHAFVSSECGACHESAFEMVKNDACIGCHEKTHQHFDSSGIQLDEQSAEKCTNCHKEHNEPAQLVIRDQNTCTDCHAHLTELTNNKTALRNVEDFGDTHPDFYLSMQHYSLDANQQPFWEILRVEHTADLTETSNLHFPHDVHLDRSGIEAPDGPVVLDCNGCHQLESNGLNFKPIEMESHCQSCHSLAFDERDPTRKVPHGAPEVVLTALEEYFSRVFLTNQQSTRPQSPTRTTRRPGQILSPATQQRAADWAKQQAQAVGEELIEKRVCNECHEIDSVVKEGQKAWRILPVKLTQTWYPKAQFDHTKHATMACSDCHNAMESDSASHLLIPNKDNCTHCHGGENSTNKLASTCLSCHEYHSTNQKYFDMKSTLK